MNATVTSSKLRGESVNYYNVLNIQKCKIGSYEKYLEIGKAYLNDNFSEMKFYESNECAFRPAHSNDPAEMQENIKAAFDLFKTSNTIYSQYFLDEVEKKN